MFRLPGQRAVALSGEAVKGRVIVEAMKRDGDLTSLDFAGVYLLLIDGAGDVQVYEECPFPLRVPAPYAIGSGREIALGALDAGQPPKQAVQIACKRDVYSGGRVRAVSVKPAS